MIDVTIVHVASGPRLVLALPDARPQEFTIEEAYAYLDEHLPAECPGRDECAACGIHEALEGIR